MLDTLSDMEVANAIMKATVGKSRDAESVNLLDKRFKDLGMEEMTPLQHESSISAPTSQPVPATGATSRSWIPAGLGQAIALFGVLLCAVALLMRRRTLQLTIRRHSDVSAHLVCRPLGELYHPGHQGSRGCRVDHVIDLEIRCGVERGPAFVRLRDHGVKAFAARLGVLDRLQLLSVGELHRTLEPHPAEFAGVSVGAAGGRGTDRG